jgi:cell division protein FtsZ
MVIVGTVIDDAMGADLRVTMIATGLGGAAAAAKRTPKMEMMINNEVIERTGTDGMGVQMGAQLGETIDYDRLEQPAVIRKGRNPPSAGAGSNFDASEIPAFLRKQAD